MTLEDLEAAGVLLPREEWGERSLMTTTNKPVLVALGALAVAACVLMYVGDGSLWTWIGAGAFLGILILFTWLSMRAVDRQIERAEGSPRAER